MYIWVNGEKVGYTENTKSPAEFDITKYVKPGKNLVAIEVYRWSDGSYLEDQDFWLSNIGMLGMTIAFGVSNLATRFGDLATFIPT